MTIQQGQMFRREHEIDGLGLARLECDPLESPQLPHRSHDGADQIAQVELHDLVPRSIAGVLIVALTRIVVPGRADFGSIFRSLYSKFV